MNEEIKDVQITQEAPETKEPAVQTADTPTPGEKVITLTQAEFDAKMKDRAARAKRQMEEALEQAKQEAERKRLEEAQEFKALYEKTQAELEQMRTAAKQAELSALKSRLLSESGFKGEEIADAMAFIGGDDEEAIKDAVERFKRLTGPRFVDPATVATGQRQQPTQKDNSYEAAREKARKLLKR